MAAPSAAKAADGRPADLHAKLSQYLDKHMLLAILPYARSRGTHPPGAVDAAMWDVVKTTSLPAAQTVWSSLHPGQPLPREYTEARAKAKAQLLADSAAAGPFVGLALLRASLRASGPLPDTAELAADAARLPAVVGAERAAIFTAEHAARLALCHARLAALPVATRTAAMAAANGMYSEGDYATAGAILAAMCAAPGAPPSRPQHLAALWGRAAAASMAFAPGQEPAGQGEAAVAAVQEAYAALRDVVEPSDLPPAATAAGGAAAAGASVGLVPDGARTTARMWLTVWGVWTFAHMLAAGTPLASRDVLLDAVCRPAVVTTALGLAPALLRHVLAVFMCARRRRPALQKDVPRALDSVEQIPDDPPIALVAAFFSHHAADAPPTALLQPAVAALETDGIGALLAPAFLRAAQGMVVEEWSRVYRSLPLRWVAQQFGLDADAGAAEAEELIARQLREQPALRGTIDAVAGVVKFAPVVTTPLRMLRDKLAPAAIKTANVIDVIG